MTVKYLYTFSSPSFLRHFPASQRTLSPYWLPLPDGHPDELAVDAVGAVDLVGGESLRRET